VQSNTSKIFGIQSTHEGIIDFKYIVVAGTRNHHQFEKKYNVGNMRLGRVVLSNFIVLGFSETFSRAS